MLKKQSLIHLIILFIVSSVLPAAAESITGNDTWHLSLTPFFLQRLVSAEITASEPENTGASGLAFSEEFLNRNTQGRKIQLAAKNKDWSLFAHYHLNAVPSQQHTAGTTLSDLRAQITKLGASYHFATWYKTDFEVLVGTRYKNNAYRSSPSVGKQGRRIDHDEWWRNTFVGLRFFNRISKNWSFVGRGDVALSNGGKDLGWNVAAMFDYSLNEWGSFYFGYKLLALDDENIDTGMERYNYNALEQGPFVGLSIHW